MGRRAGQAARGQKRRKPRKGHCVAYANERVRIVLCYQRIGTYNGVQKFLGIHRAVVKYWVLKAINPDFHNGDLGGDRRSIYKPYELAIVQREILSYMQTQPRAKLEMIRAYINNLFDRSTRKQTFRDLLKKMGWSIRVPVKFQIYKYTLKNLAYYCKFPLNRLYLTFFESFGSGINRPKFRPTGPERPNKLGE